jgi:hypothetical protein
VCTLTYHPGIRRAFTFSRDERSSRPAALLPERHAPTGAEARWYPLDPQGLGSWIALGERGRFACLLNGAFVRHERQPPYRHSRGLVVTQYFDYPDFSAFHTRYALQGLEPFTLVVYEHEALYSLVWDGSQAHARQLPTAEPVLFASATLYTPAVQAGRQAAYARFLVQQADPTPAALRDFHLQPGSQTDSAGIHLPPVADLRTVSLCQVVLAPAEHRASFLYEDYHPEQVGVWRQEVPLNPKSPPAL